MSEELKKEIERSENMLCMILKEINDSGDVTGQTLNVLDKVADILLDLSKVTECEGTGSRTRDSVVKYTDDGYGREYQKENREYLDWKR